MKKKGLIISTIVMVVVLIASLTTATYAWFTAQAQAKVTDISFSVGNASDVLIGVRNSNKIETQGASVSGALFRSGDGLAWDTDSKSWNETGNEGLGSAINTGLNLTGMTKAIWTGIPAEFTYSVDSSANAYVEGTQYYLTTASGKYSLILSAEDYAAVKAGSSVAAADNNTSDKNIYKRSLTSNTGTVDSHGTNGNGWNVTTNKHTVIKANGPTTANYDPNSVEAAIANGTGDGTNGTIKGDYLDVCFGVQSGNEAVTGIYAVIKVAPTEGTYLGMNSAIHVRYLIDTVENGEETWTDIDIYHDEHYGDTRLTAVQPGTENTKNIPASFTSDITSYGLTFAKGDAALEIPVAEVASGLPTNVIYQLHIIIFIDGWDSDCNNSAGGVSSTISIDFVTTKK